MAEVQETNHCAAEEGNSSNTPPIGFDWLVAGEEGNFPYWPFHIYFSMQVTHICHQDHQLQVKTLVAEAELMAATSCSQGATLT